MPPNVLEAIKLLGVVGAGQMGSGIAQRAATHGLRVVLLDDAPEALEASRKRIATSLSKFASKGRFSEDEAQSIASRIQYTQNFEALRGCDFAVEAVIEDEVVKRSIMSVVDAVMKPSAVLASNTSSIPITRLASATKRVDRVIGMHFMNPVPLMQLVEIIRGMATSDATFELTAALAQHLGKQICVSEDRPGFIINRILMPMINEAFFALMEGVASAEHIDIGMKLGTNHPMGPLQLADFIGLDTCLSIMRTLHGGIGDDKYRPCPLLVQYVDAGWLGKKTGRGVYTYPPP